MSQKRDNNGADDGERVSDLLLSFCSCCWRRHFFPLSHLLKSQSTDARSEALATGGACGIKAPEPHLHLLAPLGIPICQWIHLNTYLDEPRNACLRPSRPRRSATSLLHGLHRLRGGGSLRGLHRLHRHGYATSSKILHSADFS